jgi:hypothetical protein
VKRFGKRALNFGAIGAQEGVDGALMRKCGGQRRLPALAARGCFIAPCHA